MRHEAITEAVTDLSFEVELRWSGTGRQGAGEIRTDNVTFELSAPESMGGRGVGTNPEELLVCAVSSCYTATLLGVLRRARLPVDSLAVSASGAVTGFRGHARFGQIAVSPTVLGGDVRVRGSTKPRPWSRAIAASSDAPSRPRWHMRSARCG